MFLKRTFSSTPLYFNIFKKYKEYNYHNVSYNYAACMRLGHPRTTFKPVCRSLLNFTCVGAVRRLDGLIVLTTFNVHLRLVDYSGTFIQATYTHYQFIYCVNHCWESRDFARRSARMKTNKMADFRSDSSPNLR